MAGRMGLPPDAATKVLMAARSPSASSLHPCWSGWLPLVACHVRVQNRHCAQRLAAFMVCDLGFWFAAVTGSESNAGAQARGQYDVHKLQFCITECRQGLPGCDSLSLSSAPRVLTNA